MKDYGGYYKYAKQYYEQGEYEQALGYIEYAIKYSPYEEKFQEFKKEIELRINKTPVFNEPKKEIDLSLYTSQAETNKENGQYNLAIEDYTKVIELDPENNWSYQSRAQCYYELNQYEEAIEDYTKAIEIVSDWWGYYRNRGRCYEELRQYNHAIKDYSKMVELNPKDSYGYILRADCYKILKKHELAIKDYTKAIKLGPEFYWNYKARAECYEALKKFELAKKDNKEALKLSLDKGMTLFKDGDFEKAASFLEVAAELNPDDEKIASALKSAQNGKIDITICTKKGLMTLGFIDDKKADDIINARNEGRTWYNYQEFAQEFNFQPHEQLEIEEKIAFPLKQGVKFGRTVDF